MASFRYIDPDIRRSESMSQLTYRQRDLWIGLILTSDDQGRRLANEAVIRSDVWPFEDIALSEIKNDLSVFVEKGFILIYEVDDKKLLQIINWHKYQKHAEWLGMSKYQAPPGWEDRYRYHGKGNKIVISPNWSSYEPATDPQLPTILPTPLPSNDVKGDVNDDVNDDVNGEGEEVLVPLSISTSGLQFKDPELLLLDNVFLEVTSFYPPRDVDRVRETIGLIASRSNLEIKPQTVPKIASVLRPYFLEWIKRKNKSGTPYPRSSLAWLLEWAATGEIPPPAKPEKKHKTVGDLQTEPELDPKERAKLIIEAEEARKAWVRQEQPAEV